MGNAIWNPAKNDIEKRKRMNRACIGNKGREGGMLENPWWTVLGAVMGLIVCNGPIIQFAYAVFLKPLTEESSPAC